MLLLLLPTPYLRLQNRRFGRAQIFKSQIPFIFCRFQTTVDDRRGFDYSGLNPTLFTKRPSRGGFFGIHVVRAFWGFRGRSWPLSLFPLPRPTESAATRSSSEAGHIARSIQDRLSRAFASAPREQNCRQVES